MSMERGTTLAGLAGVAARLKAKQQQQQIAWTTLARPDQLPPEGEWRTWLILAGRRWGKTRTGAETLTRWDAEGSAHNIAAIGQTAADSRDILLFALRNEIIGKRPDGTPMFRERQGVTYEPSKLLLHLKNGARVRFFSAEDPDSLRGYGFDAAWADELAAWRFPETYDQLQFGLSLGGARQIVTTTPRPTKIIRELIADPSTVITRGRTLDNAANLDTASVTYLVNRYGDTRMGRQELEGEVLEDVVGALWTGDMIRYRLAPTILIQGDPQMDLQKVVVAVDPNTTQGDDADECGITVHGIGYDGVGYLLADRSARVGPREWGPRAVKAAYDYSADEIVIETNQGGDMALMTLESVVQDFTRRNGGRHIPIKKVTASRGKRTRAEPIAQLYEQKRIFHVRPFGELEDQLTHWTPETGDSPDRLDAMVWGWTYLMADPRSDGWRTGSYGSRIA